VVARLARPLPPRILFDDCGAPNRLVPVEALAAAAAAAGCPKIELVPPTAGVAAAFVFPNNPEPVEFAAGVAAAGAVAFPNNPEPAEVVAGAAFRLPNRLPPDGAAAVVFDTPNIPPADGVDDGAVADGVDPDDALVVAGVVEEPKMLAVLAGGAAAGVAEGLPNILGC
jgi:hypothetical protein